MAQNNLCQLVEKSGLKPWFSDTKTMFLSMHSAASLPEAVCRVLWFPFLVLYHCSDPGSFNHFFTQILTENNTMVSIKTYISSLVEFIVQ